MGEGRFITICCKERAINQFCHNDVFELVKASMHFRQDRGDFWVHLLLLIPDHLHAIMSFSSEVEMKRSVSQWKRYISTYTNVQWQRDFFDHRLRHDESYVEKAHYIRMNPVRSGLVEDFNDWKYVWENRR